MSESPRRTNSGPGRALVAVYGIFALAATSRATVQLATRYDEAPLAYLLSAFAAVVYIVATVTPATARTMPDVRVRSTLAQNQATGMITTMPIR